MKIMLLSIATMLVLTNQSYAISKIKLTDSGNCSYYAQQKLEQKLQKELTFLDGTYNNWMFLDGKQINNYTIRMSTTPKSKQGLCLLTPDANKSNEGHIFWYDNYSISDNTITTIGSESSTYKDTQYSSNIFNGAWYRPTKNTYQEQEGIIYINLMQNLDKRLKMLQNLYF